VLKNIAAAVLAFLFAAAVCPGEPPAPSPQSKEAENGAPFAINAGVIELRQMLAEYHPSGAPADNSVWYVFTAINNSKQTSIRVLLAGQPPGSGLELLPHPARPAILQATSANPAVVIEHARDYGRHAFRVSLPPYTSAMLAIRIEGAGSPPSLMAWTEPALSTHNRWMAICFAAVAGLIAAAAAIAGGLAVISHREAPRWAAYLLLTMLMTRLAGTGLFDGSLVTYVGGPYGLIALFAGLSLTAGLRLADIVLPLKEVWPGAERWFNWILYGVAAVSVLAYLGVPAATLLIDIACVLAAADAAVYAVMRSRKGSRAARAMAPCAIMFALFGLTVAFTAMGGFGADPLTPDIAGGFAAAGAVLLALAMAAGDGVGVLSLVRHPATAAPPPPPPPPPAIPHAALEAIGASFQGVFELDLGGDFVILSKEAARLFGLPDKTHRWKHSVWMSRIHPDDRPVYAQAVKDFGAMSDFAFRIEFRARNEDNRYLWFELRATMKGPESSPAKRCVGLLADITTRKESEAAVMDRTLRDTMTGLGNRVALMEEIEALGGKLNDAVYALIDIDRFKAIHASLGDAGGDALLTMVARRLEKRYRGAADVFRVGGDAFAVLGSGVKADKLGAELVELCGAVHQLDGRNVFAPVSVGVAEGSEARNPLNLLNNAELALRQAKRQGGGCYSTYAPGMEATAPADSVELEAALRQALDDGAMEVFYQPIVRLSDRSVAGFEALLRWRHPDKGLIAPSDFIAHSEASGLIVSLGRFALKRAADDLAEWQRYFPLGDALFVSVNLSRRQLFDSELDTFIIGLLRKGNLASGSLVLEVTESAVAAQGAPTDRFSRLRAAGAGLAIDDFGTGLSSLGQLKDLPFDTVKIDKSFLSKKGGVSTSDGDKVLSSIVALARELRRRVVVEGVENEEDAGRLTRIGCEYAQGFLFAEPLTMRDAMHFIARHFRASGTKSDRG
jgi:diguanylate cyclase (GGDEF)-like protein